MRDPIYTQSVLAGSARARSPLFPLVRTRTLSITFRCTFGAGATSDAIGEVYYSPDGIHLDSLPFGRVNVTISAGNTVQATAVIVLPEHGFVYFALLNGDSTVITDVQMYSSVQSWSKEQGADSHGNPELSLGAE